MSEPGSSEENSDLDTDVFLQVDTESPQELDKAYQLYLRYYRPELVIGSDEYKTRLKPFKKSVEDAQITMKNYQEGKIGQRLGVSHRADWTDEEKKPRKRTKEETLRFFRLPEGYKFEKRKPPPPDKYFRNLVKDVDTNNKADVERAYKEYYDLHRWDLDTNSEHYPMLLKSFGECVKEAHKFMNGPNGNGVDEH